jgi:hypothetical protein
MLKRNVGRVSVALLVAALGAPALAQDKPSSIDQLAPENSVFVIGAKNFGASMDRFKSTRLWDFWQSPDAKAIRDKFEEMTKEGLDQIAEELDMEMEEFPTPTGAAGFALFTVEDDEAGTTRPGVLLYADFGDQSEQMYALVQKMLDRGEEEGDITVETVNRIDREGWRLEFNEPKDAEDDGGDMDGEEEWEEWDEGPSGPPFDAIEIIKDGTMLMICSDQEALEQALNARDGEDIQSVGDRDDHKAIKQQTGDGEIYGALLMRDFWEAMGAFEGGGGGMQMMMVSQMMEQFLGKIDGAGWTLALGGNAMIEQTWFVYMPMGKSGLTSLIGAPTGRPRVPSFVTPETSSYFSLNIDTAAIAPFVRNVMRTMAPMMGGQIDQQTMEDIERRVNEIFATMGNELHIATRIVRPLSANSQRMLFAMECEKPQEFETLIAKEAPQIGLESRDFLGQRIYTADPMGTGDPEQTFSVGIGGGYIIIGPSPDVELALRAAGEADPVTLEGDLDFKRAMQPFASENAVAWAFADVVDSIDASMRVQIAAQREAVEEMRQFAPEYADEMLANINEMEKQLEMMPSPEVMRRYIGPTASYIQSIDEGFVGKSFIMPGTEE